MSSESRGHLPLTNLPEAPIFSGARESAADFRETIADFTKTGLGFLKIEVEMGLTFATIAIDCGDDFQRARRNAANAWKAYESVLRFRSRLQLGFQENAELKAKVESLRLKLQELSEQMQGSCGQRPATGRNGEAGFLWSGRPSYSGKLRRIGRR